MSAQHTGANDSKRQDLPASTYRSLARTLASQLPKDVLTQLDTLLGDEATPREIVAMYDSALTHHLSRQGRTE